MQDIADEPLICCDQEPALHKYILDIYRKHNLRPNIRAVLPDWGAQFANVSYNAGVAITPVIPMASDMIAVRDLDDPMSIINYNCLYRTGGTSNKIVKKLLQIAIGYSEQRYHNDN